MLEMYFMISDNDILLKWQLLHPGVNELMVFSS